MNAGKAFTKTLLPAAAVVLMGCQGAPDRTHPFTASALPVVALGADADRLSVLSFNMQHRDKPAQLAVMAERLRSDLADMPDFILCQEVLFQRSRHKGHDNTATVLAEELGYYCHGTKRRSDREGVAIISRHPFVHYSQRDLKARTSGLLLGFRRVSIMGEFLVPGMGRVRVVNVHLAHWPFEHHIRYQQLKETLQWIADRDREVPADVIVLGGDFNIQPGWSEMGLLTDSPGPGELRYLDLNSSDPTRGRPGAPRVRVDYIFVAAPDRDLRMLGERLLYKDGLLTGDGGNRRFWLSDHVPLLHEYAIGSRRLAATSVQ